MESFYIVIVGILFLLAITDLTVGVSNDATNFLVGAIGSKSAKFWVIMLIASLGVMMGAIFSSGMMEVARNGIFKPDMFVFSEVMIIFLAVMLTDVILLDFFNTFGFPTSTTVSLIFGLLGASVAVALIKINSEGGVVADYINSEKAMGIVSGILVSVVIAFAAGVIVQFIARTIFSFNIEKSYKYFGSLWGGISLAIITYFMFIKGLKGSVLAEMDFVKFAMEHKLLIFAASFGIWTIVFQLLIWFTKINVLKIVVLAGTFALAMAFAGNDLVNFIGVPLAGFASFQSFYGSGISPDSFTMESLLGAAKSPTFILLISGLIMVLTLWLSKKAKTVTETAVNLSRQDAGYERFGSTALSRSIVRFFVATGNVVNSAIPLKIRNKLTKRFELIKSERIDGKEIPAFDLVRASVNLVVSSILIVIGTTNKLPLSTTYVTFMVAMATSLADGAWGRESAVYRVTGVISVIGGWFFTGLIAFTLAFLIAIILHAGGYVAVVLLVLFAGFLFYRTKVIHKKREKEKEEEASKIQEESIITEENVFEKCKENVLSVTENVPLIISNTIEGLKSEDIKLLKKMKKKTKKMNKETKEYKSNIHTIIQVLKPSFLNSAQYYVQVMDYLREISNATQFVVAPSFEHIDNIHEGFIAELYDDLKKLENSLISFIAEISFAIKEEDFSNQAEIEEIQQNVLSEIEELRSVQLLRIKNNLVDTRSSIVYLNILSESKNIVLYFLRLMKAQRAFVESKNILV